MIQVNALPSLKLDEMIATRDARAIPKQPGRDLKLWKGVESRGNRECEKPGFELRRASTGGD